MSQIPLEVRNLAVTFEGRHGMTSAVRGIDLTVAEGEVLGLVGESGSGKSVAMRAVLGLLPATAHVSGSVRLRGEELTGQPRRRFRSLRGRRMAMIFQDPMTALNPVHRIGHQIAEVMQIHNPKIRQTDALAKAQELLEEIAIPEATRRLRQYPFELSGGMRQRVVIAIAMANNPDLLIADEPTTALDVTVQAQILEVLQRLRDRHRIGMVLITHDLGVVAGMADRVAVMYAGRIVETGPVDELFEQPKHPYTRGLLAATPHIAGGVVRGIEGVPPALDALPDGCPFAPRCTLAIPTCRIQEPSLRLIRATRVACHLADAVLAPEHA